MVATVTDTVLAPRTAVAGTVTVSVVEDAAVTVATIAPIFTLFDAMVDENPRPVITKEPPRATLAKLRLEITGAGIALPFTDAVPF